GCRRSARRPKPCAVSTFAASTCCARSRYSSARLWRCDDARLTRQRARAYFDDPEPAAPEPPAPAAPEPPVDLSRCMLLLLVPLEPEPMPLELAPDPVEPPVPAPWSPQATLASAK